MIIQSPWFRYGLFAATGLTIAAWIIMVTITFPNLEAYSGGLKVFDMLPMGYSFDEAREIISRLGPDGSSYYISKQQAVDSLFPALVFLTVSGWQISIASHLAAIGKKPPMALMVICIAVNLLGAIADYSENGAVRRMLLDGAEALEVQQVASANMMTIAKSAFNTLSYSALLVFLVYYRIAKRKT